MAEQRILEHIQQIFASGAKATFVVTGAGSQALQWLLSVGGASSTVLEMVIPYGQKALEEYLGWLPEKFVSETAAAALSAAAYARALRFGDDEGRLLAVACTAAIATNRVKKGLHHALVSIRSRDQVTSFSLRIKKGLRDRKGEEEMVSQLILLAVAKDLGVLSEVNLELDAEERLNTSSQPREHALDDLFANKAGSVLCYGPEAMVTDVPFQGLIMPGSFNPAHEGHLLLAKTAERKTGRRLAFELSIGNVDKEDLSRVEILERLAQDKLRDQRVLLTREPLFVDKAKVFPGSTFVIGYDTASRIVNPKYYDGDAEKMRAALEGNRETECSFLVAGRLAEGKFRTLKDLAIPKGFENLFDGLSEDEFRLDISSTEIRNQSH